MGGAGAKGARVRVRPAAVAAWAVILAAMLWGRCHTPQTSSTVVSGSSLRGVIVVSPVPSFR